MGSRDRPSKEKKKPKAEDRPAEPVAAVGAAAERRGDPQAAQGADRSSRTTRTKADRPADAIASAPASGPHGSDEERDGQMAMTEERAAERNTAERGKAVDAALATIEKQFGRGAIMKLGSREQQVARHDPDRLDRARPRARRRRHPARPDHRDLRPGVVGQDDRLPARPRRGPGARRRRRLHRRRARARSRLRPRLRRQRRRAPRQPAGHRRAGARDHRDAHPLRRHRLRRRRLRRGARAARRDRGRDGRLASWASRPG